ncbi:MAG: HlyD family efflux transporter periplasmic adaptor subunit [Gemmatimonadales bacterium]|nr:HlyD family efflux transporter periplasmic adaptor subunit [Gemmatimonadales bacterium]
MAAPRRFPAVPPLLALLVLAACRTADDPLAARGTVEVREVDVAPLAPARVVRVLADEGMRVRRGDTIAVLAQSVMPATLDAQRARLGAAEANLRDLEAGSRAEELRRAEADSAQADAELERAARDAERLRGLAERQVVAAQQLDAAETARRAARARRDAAVAQLALLRRGTREERVRAGRAEVAGARASLRMAEAQAGDLVLLAPIDGMVLGRYAEPGDVVPTGTAVVTLGDLAAPWVRVFLPARVVAGLRHGDTLDVTLDGVPGRQWAGTVSAIRPEAEFTPRSALTEEERADLLIGVKVAIADTSGLLKPGLPATVRRRAP